MFEGRGFRRGCLLPVVIALVAAMVCAVGSASTSATAGPEDTNSEKTTLKVTGVEKGVKATAYKYMNVSWDANSEKAKLEFEAKVADWVADRFPDYIEKKSPSDKLKNDTSADDRSSFFGQLLTAIADGEVELSPHGEVVEASGGSDKAEILFSFSMGGYLIKLSNGSSHVYQPIVTNVCPKLDATAPDGYKLGATKDFDPTSLEQIVAQSQEVTSKKTVNGQEKTHAQIGDSVTYMIEIKAPKYPVYARNQKFVVQDCPDPGLIINQSSIQVKVGDKTLDGKNDYTLTTVSDDEKGVGFKVEFKDYSVVFQDSLADGPAADKNLTVTYSAMLNSNAPIENGVKNSAYHLISKDHYGSKTDAGYTKPPSVLATTVYTYGIHLTKVDDSESETGLAGAQFKLYKGTKDSGTEVKVESKPADTAREKEGATMGTYVVAANSGSSALPGLSLPTVPGAGVPTISGSTVSSSTTIISGSDGVVQIDGLGAGTYTLQEIEAPKGYDPAAPVTIEIKDNDFDGKPDRDSMIGGRMIAPDGHNRLSYKLKNTRTKTPEEQQPDFTLPKTGAMGTAVFSALGVVLVAASAALVIVRRRKDKQSS